MFSLLFLALVYEFVNYIRLNPWSGGQSKANAKWHREAGHIHKCKGLCPQLRQIILIAEVRPVTGDLVESKASNRHRNSPKCKLPVCKGEALVSQHSAVSVRRAYDSDRDIQTQYSWMLARAIWTKPASLTLMARSSLTKPRTKSPQRRQRP